MQQRYRVRRLIVAIALMALATGAVVACAASMSVKPSKWGGPLFSSVLPSEWKDQTLRHIPTSQGNNMANPQNEVSVTPSAYKACAAPSIAPPNYYIPPKNMLDWSHPGELGRDPTFLVGFHVNQFGIAQPSAYTTSITLAPNDTGAHLAIGSNDGRLRPELRQLARAVANQTDAGLALCMAARAFDGLLIRAGDDPMEPTAEQWADAFADLSVTGRVALESFLDANYDHEKLAKRRDCAGASSGSIDRALERANQVLDALKGSHESIERQRLRWIAVSGEDDLPMQPVNVPATRLPTFFTDVTVPPRATKRYTRAEQKVTTRYMVGQALCGPNADGEFKRRKMLRTLHPREPLPDIPPGSNVLLFIHGMDSKIEEANDLLEAMQKIGRDSKENWVVIAMDLPTSGYATHLDPEAIVPGRFVTCGDTPLLDFIEDFIVAFVDTLDAKVKFKDQIVAVVGGSLGGNMTMRLGRRKDLPWIKTVVSWSPAAVWGAMMDTWAFHTCTGCDLIAFAKDIGTNQTLDWSGRQDYFRATNESQVAPGPANSPYLELRHAFFYGGYDWLGPPIEKIFKRAEYMSQAACWYRDDDGSKWDCKERLIVGSRIDRQETYDANFRAWHWRLGTEQVVFSQVQNNPETHQPLYLDNTTPMLLLTGRNDICADLDPDAQEVARKMVHTPGVEVIFSDTGHSMDNEWPDFFAHVMVEFLGVEVKANPAMLPNSRLLTCPSPLPMIAPAMSNSMSVDTHAAPSTSSPAASASPSH